VLLPRIHLLPRSIQISLEWACTEIIDSLQI
jgi:hypothetical protein